MPALSLYSFLNRHLLFTLIGALLTITASAQKQPNKQATGLRAPAQVKIDGKDTEWHNQFQAYNNATEVFYSMANDNENLYLSVQATQPDIINKIMSGGITLTIQKSTKKDNKSSVSITYPIAANAPYFGLRRKKNIEEDTTAKTADSIMKRNNALIVKSCKWIRVTGIPGVDSLTSIYNVNGIKAAGLFDNKKVYTCELSVKLEHLKTAIANGQTFNYHIRINGSKTPVSFTAVSASQGNDAVMQQFIEKANAMGIQQAAATDFWGEYTLVK